MPHRNAVVVGPDPVDAHVGLRLREIRLGAGKSQEDVAEAIGKTFQQVQKYEKGSNRISASVLVGLARALSVPVNAFFEGVDQPRAALEAERRDLEISRHFQAIPNGRLKDSIYRLVKDAARGEATHG